MKANGTVRGRQAHHNRTIKGWVVGGGSAYVCLCLERNIYRRVIAEHPQPLRASFFNYLSLCGNAKKARLSLRGEVFVRGTSHKYDYKCY